MSQAGYSGTPLPRKLGLKAGWKVALLGAPEGLEDSLGPGLTIKRSMAGELNAILLFARRMTELKRVPTAAEKIAPDGMLWICWPKKSSGVATDVTEADVHRAGLLAGLVDNKVCAVDEVFSGLRFVVRLADRAKR